MYELQLEWDEAKDRANQSKHRISFTRAAQVFEDPGVVIAEDRVENGEERWHAIGIVDGIILLTVVHTYRYDTENG